MNVGATGVVDTNNHRKINYMSNEPFVENERRADGEQKDPCEEIFDSVKNAFKSGTDEAKKQAEKTAPKIKTAIGKAAYKLSFGAAYGSSFGLAMLKAFVPDVLKDGSAEGFDAGKTAAERAMTPKENTESGVFDVDYSVS